MRLRQALTVLGVAAAIAVVTHGAARAQDRPVPPKKPTGNAPDRTGDADQPPRTPGGVPLPGGEELPGEDPPNFDTGIDFKPTPPRSRVTFNLEDASLQDLVRLISSITGRRFIIPGKIRQIKATVYAPQKVSAAEAYQAFLSILELNGLALVPSGRYLKVVESSGIEARTIPLLIDGEAPREDRYVTSVIRVENVAADDISQILSKFKSPEGSITAYAPTNTLIITDIGANIRRMQRLIEAIDMPQGGEQLWIEPIHYANATELAERLTELFPTDEENKPSTAQKKSARARKARNRAKKNAATEGTTTTVGATAGGFRIRSILADERTNSLLIIATETAYLRVLELIRHLDIPLEEEGGIHVHPLQHGDAEDVSQTLSQLVSGSTGKQRGKGAKPGEVGTFEGDISITAHDPTNSLVITSSLQDYVALRRVIDKLDSERRQVFIEAVIMDLNISRGRDLGVSFHGGAPNVPTDDSLSIFGFDAQRTATGTVSQDLLTGLAVGVRGPEIPESQDLIGLSVPAFGVALTALASSSNTNVLSTPHLIALDNEEAEINIGQNVPLQGSAFGGLGGLGGLGALGALGGAQGAQGAAGQQGMGGLGGMLGAGIGAVPRQDVGTRVRITPHINDSDEIRLEIDQEISELGTTVPGNAQAAVINRRTAKTQVVVRDQETVVIGGLMRDSVSTSEEKVPVLGDIPLLGALFRKREKNTAKTNLLLFLTPYIIRSQADLRSIYERKMRERQEFLDRYFVFADSDYNPSLDHSRTRGLVAEMVIHSAELEELKRLAEEAARETDKEHVPRPPVGILHRAGEADEAYDLEDGDVLIEEGEVAEPAASPAPAEPAPPAAPTPPEPEE